MSADEESRASDLLESLSVAVGRWVEGGNAGPLGRWLARELDADGVPRRLAIRDWPRCLEVLAGARRRGSWPPGCEAPIAGFVLAALRFTRPDGSRCLLDRGAPGRGRGPGCRGTGPTGTAGRGSRGSSAGGSTPGAGRSARSTETAPPPLPAWSASGPGAGDPPPRLAPRRRLPGRRSPRSAIAVPVRAPRRGADVAGPGVGRRHDRRRAGLGVAAPAGRGGSPAPRPTWSNGPIAGTACGSPVPRSCSAADAWR